MVSSLFYDTPLLKLNKNESGSFCLILRKDTQTNARENITNQMQIPGALQIWQGSFSIQILVFSQVQKEICSGKSQMVGILQSMKEKQADLLSSQGGIVMIFKAGNLSFDKTTVHLPVSLSVWLWRELKLQTSRDSEAKHLMFLWELIAIRLWIF